MEKGGREKGKEGEKERDRGERGGEERKSRKEGEREDGERILCMCLSSPL